MTGVDHSIVQRIQQLPVWTPDAQIEALDGGITNHNYLVQSDGSQYVVRLGDDIPVHHIRRANEFAAGSAAWAAGLSPRIQHHERGVLVMDYIPSQPLSEADIRDTAVLERVLSLVKQCHHELPRYLRGGAPAFWVFHVIRDYAATLRDGNSEHCHRLDTWLQQAEQLERAAGPFEIVFGHNDLLAANLLNDGQRLWLIDWEYAGFNTPLFDLGGLASNNELDAETEGWMLECYFERTVDKTLWRQYSAMKCASLLRESLWSMVSEIHSDIAFDYAEYTRENTARYEASYANFTRA